MSTVKSVKSQPLPEGSQAFIFDKRNYVFMIIGLLVMMLGFILMIGGGSADPSVFNEDIFNFQRITLSPILVIAGLVIEVVAIMIKPASAIKE